MIDCLIWWIRIPRRNFRSLCRRCYGVPLIVIRPWDSPEGNAFSFPLLRGPFGEPGVGVPGCDRPESRIRKFGVDSGRGKALFLSPPTATDLSKTLPGWFSRKSWAIALYCWLASATKLSAHSGSWTEVSFNFLTTSRAASVGSSAAETFFTRPFPGSNFPILRGAPSGLFSSRVTNLPKKRRKKIWWMSDEHAHDISGTHLIKSPAFSPEKARLLENNKNHLRKWDWRIELSHIWG